MKTTRTEPFLKWAGGKRNLLPQILRLLPTLNSGATYYEPFLGGGAVFFALQPSQAVLSDINAELIETFVSVRDEVDSVIDVLAELPYSSEDYYRIRDDRFSTSAERAARFIYLNKTCFNGLYRVNRRGEFNVPFGRHGPNIEICNREQLILAAKALQRSVVGHADFEESIANAVAGDLVYFDPPYITGHTNNGFVEYNAKVFSWQDQHRLAYRAKELIARGVNVAISNANHPLILELYLREEFFKSHEVKRQSTIAGSAAKRFATIEVLLVGRGEGEDQS